MIEIDETDVIPLFKPRVWTAVLRAGSGQLPSVIVAGECDQVDTWSKEPSMIEIKRVVSIPENGNLGLTRKAFVEAMPDAWRKRYESGANMAQWPSKRVAAPVTAIDETSDPAAREILPFHERFIVTTGRGSGRTDDGAERLGRIDLLSDLKSRMSRGQLKAVPGMEARDADLLRRSLVEITARPPRNETDGIALVECDLVESVALAVALFARLAATRAAVRGMSDADRSRAYRRMGMLSGGPGR